VERRINAVTYVVKRSPNGKSFTVHVDTLKLFRGTVPTAWAKYCEDPETVSDKLAGPVSANQLAGPVSANQLAGPVSADQLAGPVVLDRASESTSAVTVETGVTNNFGRHPGAPGQQNRPPGLLKEDKAPDRIRRNVFKPKWMQSYVTVVKTRSEYTTSMDAELTRNCHL
jgi:hypothetical protein